MDIFNIIMHCLVFHVVSGAAAAYYAYRRCKVVGAACSYGILSASVLWSVIGTLIFRQLPFRETAWGVPVFILWNLLIFLPWVKCIRRKKQAPEIVFWTKLYAILTPITFLIGILLAGMRQNNHLSLVLSNINGIFFCYGFLMLALAIAFFVLFLVTCWQKEKYSLLKIPLSFILPATTVFFFFAGLFCFAFR